MITMSLDVSKYHVLEKWWTNELVLKYHILA